MLTLLSECYLFPGRYRRLELLPYAAHLCAKAVLQLPFSCCKVSVLINLLNVDRWDQLHSSRFLLLFSKPCGQL